MDQEIWKSVVGHEGLYAVSDRGRVRRLVKRRSCPPGVILCPRTRGAGYPQVTLDGYRASVHRLVLAAFVGPCPPGMECNHLNGIKTDNRVENLEWVTRSENNLHAYRILGHKVLRGEEHGAVKLREAEVRVIKQAKARKIPAKWLGEWFKVARSTIYHIWGGTTWKHIAI